MTTGAGPLLREWRGRRRRSQLDLAHSAGVSPRHLSFVETGRATPSPQLLLTLASHLDVPLRDRNALLLAAGYAPRYGETALDDPANAAVRAALARLLVAHDPYPGVVLDRWWDVVLANEAASRLTAGLPAELRTPRPNVFRISLHPAGLAAITLDFADWAGHLLGQLRRLVLTTGDSRLAQLEREVLAYPNVAALDPTDRRLPEEPRLLVPYRLRLGADEVAMFSTLTSFGTPRDITLDELAAELFFPADPASEAVLRKLAH